MWGSKWGEVTAKERLAQATVPRSQGDPRNQVLLNLLLLGSKLRRDLTLTTAENTLAAEINPLWHTSEISSDSN